MLTYRKFITKSRAGHYTATVRAYYENGCSAVAFSERLLSTRPAAVRAADEFIASAQA